MGNYLGALKQFVALQSEYECIYCVVDLHAITMRIGADELRNSIRHTAASFLACGIDPKKHIIFNQSKVAAHSELQWILSCIARIGWLDRMTQFKEKVGKDKERASVGLYVYPVLMAADILAYRASHVPVGEDQRQHLELARDIAQKFNKDFAGDLAEGFFPLPEPVIGGAVPRVMSLRDGSRKMSKSEASEQARIGLEDSADDIALKIRKAKSDGEPLPETKEGLASRPEAGNLVALYGALAGVSIEEVLAQFGGGNFSPLKEALTEKLIAEIVPIGEKIGEIKKDIPALDALLAEGAERAAVIANPVLQEVKRRMGLL